MEELQTLNLLTTDRYRVSPLHKEKMGYKDKEKQREYQRQWMAKRRQEWIDENGPCACGSFNKLEVDHIDPKLKTMEVRSIWSCRKEIRELELAKCQVLCYDCHLEKTLINGDAALKQIKFSRTIVDNIRNEYKNGDVTYKELSIKYNVSINTVGGYIRNEKRKYNW